ncbi:metallophosphoesterase [Sphingomonas sp.]|uniref:metallophosphoesterase n=1 Tax=Sphingomonas sp. TaxID=28214 RepID=UPI0025E38886|nr:metallophosphoesterase [Sphingomonas sp.]
MSLTASSAEVPEATVLAQEPCGAIAPSEQEIEPVADGPYVEMAESGWIARSVSADGRAVTAPSGAGHLLAIAPADGVLGFTVPLRDPVEAPPPAVQALADNVPLMVVADTHGEFGILIALLQAQGIIDAALSWTFGTGQVVVLGDVVDRGAYQIEILWLLYGLEAQAAAKGGALHFILGNHEALMLQGDKRYLHPRYHRTGAILGRDRYADLLGPKDVLGQWLRSRNAMLKLGDNLFVHGGLSPGLIDEAPDIAEINDRVRAGIDMPLSSPPLPGDMSADREGPLWYRGYFRRRHKRVSDADVGRSLDHFGVRRIFVGHTPVDRVAPKFRGRVIAAHVYPARDKATGQPQIEAVLRVNGRLLGGDATGQRWALRAVKKPAPDAPPS